MKLKVQITREDAMAKAIPVNSVAIPLPLEDGTVAQAPGTGGGAKAPLD